MTKINNTFGYKNIHIACSASIEISERKAITEDIIFSKMAEVSKMFRFWYSGTEKFYIFKTVSEMLQVWHSQSVTQNNRQTVFEVNTKNEPKTSSQTWTLTCSKEYFFNPSLFRWKYFTFGKMVASSQTGNREPRSNILQLGKKELQ